MNSMPVALRSLLIYLICLPLALFLGYQLTNPLSYEAVFTVGIVLGILLLPVLLKWHRPILVFSLGAAMVVFFLPGRPKLGLVMVAVSLLISILQRTIQPNFRFIRVPEMTWPLMAMLGVVFYTMLLQGGFGLSFFGARTAGGSRYLMLILGALCFFALTAQPIPRERLNLYIGLFFLSGLTAAIGDFFALVPGVARPIFLFFPPSKHAFAGEFDVGQTRLFGVTLMAASAFRYILARYGVSGLMVTGSRLRLVVFLGITALSLVGGARLTLLSSLLLFGVLFYLEGLHRTRLLIPVVAVGVVVAAVTVAFLPRMPFTVQRTLAFLPLPIDPAAKLSADASSEWRLEMWRNLLPEVPRHLLLGRGLAVSDADLQAITNQALSARTPDQWLWAAITGDFHNGPLSVVLTFGVWGLIAFVWLQIAGLRVLYLNYRNGAPELRILNTYLFAQFLVQVVVFWFVFGSMYSETIIFTSMVGFGVAANGGVCRQPVAQPAPAPSARPAVPRPLRPRQPGRPPVGLPLPARAPVRQ